jgi:hypothetical protein
MTGPFILHERKQCSFGDLDSASRLPIQIDQLFGDIDKKKMDWHTFAVNLSCGRVEKKAPFSV